MKNKGQKGIKGPEGDKNGAKNSTLRPKLQNMRPKTAGVHVHVMKMGTSSPKIVLESKSGRKIGPEGDKRG